MCLTARTSKYRHCSPCPLLFGRPLVRSFVDLSDRSNNQPLAHSKGSNTTNHGLSHPPCNSLAARRSTTEECWIFNGHLKRRRNTHHYYYYYHYYVLGIDQHLPATQPQRRTTYQFVKKISKEKNHPALAVWIFVSWSPVFFEPFASFYDQSHLIQFFYQQLPVITFLTCEESEKRFI